MTSPASDETRPDYRALEVKELVNLAQAGDPEALNELFTRHYQTMLHVARMRLGARLRSKEEPDDLAQTTFREATRDFKSYTWRGEGSLLSWLIQILQNKIRDRAEFYSATKRDLSKERSIDAVPANAEGRGVNFFEPPSDDLTVTMQVQQKEDFDLVRRALEELSEDHRKAITLVFFQGRSLREAGQLMDGRTEDAVRMLLRRAEGRLGEILRRHYRAGDEDEADEGERDADEQAEP
ncbi:MAG: sigma-70 family RNA polymerase sigma factor [Planctomycetes bacterium]|nr:sigma-70 family RNA polymerase sigma factor [Planctomycetota bacterium]